MKIITLSLFLFIGLTLNAQISFNTGDSGFDAELNIVNNDAKKDLEAFKTQLSKESSVSVPKLSDFLKIMEPAEVWLATKIASISKQPVDKVVETYKVNKDKGWGVIAKEMGIKPGSPEFHELKAMTKGAHGNSGNKGSGHSTGNGNNKGNGKSK